jgi:hypothetical protein
MITFALQQFAAWQKRNDNSVVMRARHWQSWTTALIGSGISDTPDCGSGNPGIACEQSTAATQAVDVGCKFGLRASGAVNSRQLGDF